MTIEHFLSRECAHSFFHMCERLAQAKVWCEWRLLLFCMKKVVRSWVESGGKFLSACNVGRRSFLRPEVGMLLNNMPLDW